MHSVEGLGEYLNTSILLCPLNFLSSSYTGATACEAPWACQVLNSYVSLVASLTESCSLLCTTVQPMFVRRLVSLVRWHTWNAMSNRKLPGSLFSRSVTCSLWVRILTNSYMIILHQPPSAYCGLCSSHPSSVSQTPSWRMFWHDFRLMTPTIFSSLEFRLR